MFGLAGSAQAPPGAAQRCIGLVDLVEGAFRKKIVMPRVKSRHAELLDEGVRDLRDALADALIDDRAVEAGDLRVIDPHGQNIRFVLLLRALSFESPR